MSLIECRAEIVRSALATVEAAVEEHGGVGWSVYEDVIAQRAWLIGVFAEPTEARERWAALRTHLPARALSVPAWREMADQDWRDSYKAHFKPWRCGTLHWVPEWKRASHRLPRGHSAVYLDPGLAFGTGNHATTRLCCRRLVEFARGLPPRKRRAARVIDAGCGSGILAISAVKLGCTRVFAFDNDADAVAIAQENARRNGVHAAVCLSVGGVAEMLGRRRADLVLANIQADVLLAHRADLLGSVNPGGWLVLSGILATEASQIRDAFCEAAGSSWKVRSRRTGEWVDFVMIRARTHS